MTNDLLTISQAADVLGVSRTTAYNWARDGVIPVVRVARVLRVPAVALSTWQHDLQQEALARVVRSEPAP